MTDHLWKPPTFKLHTQTDLWNAFLSYQGHPFALSQSKEGVATFEVVPPPLKKELVLSVRYGAGGDLFVCLDEIPLQRMAGVDLSAEQLFNLPPPLRTALCEALLSWLWDLLPEHHLGECALVEITDLPHCTPNPDALTWVALRIEGIVDAAVTLRIGLFLDSFLAHSVRGDLAPRRIWPALEDQLFSEAFFTLGSLEMTQAALKALRTGDMLVLDAQASEEVRIRVEEHNKIYVCSLDDDELVCERIEKHRQ